MRVAIIGGGLAGCAAAYVLKQAGAEPVIYEATGCLAAGASGNEIGLYNPRFGAEWSPQSQYYSAAFHRALEVFEHLDSAPTPALPLKGEGVKGGRIDFNPSGCLHLINDDKKSVRYAKMIDSWGWDIDAMRIVSACEASDIAGVDLVHDALYLPRSGSVCPRRLCQVYADGVEVRLNTPLHSSLHGLSVQSNGDALKADAVILAAGPALRSFDAVKNLDLRAVRGQVTLVKAALPLKTNICYGGYISAAQGGRHAVGASFQRWLDHAAIIDQDDHDNLANLARAIPAFPKDLEVIGHRAAVRCTTRDHFPVVGPIGDNLYVSAAHGSHGILSALMAADILAAMIFGRRPLVSDAVISALSPHRFVD